LVVEDIVFITTQTDRPVVAGLHRSLMDDDRSKTVFVLSEGFILLICDGFAVLYLAAFMVFETVEMQHQNWWEHTDVQLLYG
jgi:hypothetical protein